ncbi:hypothetical protein WDU94_014086 [Cyamophila willieti]
MATLESTSELQVERLLEKALILIELTLDLRDKSHIGEKYACDLKSLAWKACQITSAIQQSTKDFLQLAEHIIKSALDIITTDRKDEEILECESKSALYETDTLQAANGVEENSNQIQRVKERTEMMYKELINLQNILKKDIELYEKPSDIKLFKTKSSSSIGDMIKTLQTKQQKRKDLSPRVCKDDKYPERTSRESLLDQANLSLQTVHEDSFTEFSQQNETNIHQSSALSLKNLRRIQKFLQSTIDYEMQDFKTKTSFTGEDIRRHETIKSPNKSFSRLVHSASGNSILGARDVEYAETVIKNEGSNVNLLLDNISEED